MSSHGHTILSLFLTCSASIIARDASVVDRALSFLISEWLERESLILLLPNERVQFWGLCICLYNLHCIVLMSDTNTPTRASEKYKVKNKNNWRNKWIYKQTNQNEHTNEKERPHQKQTLSTRPTLFTLIYPVSTFLSWLLHLYLLKKIYIWNSQ